MNDDLRPLKTGCTTRLTNNASILAVCASLLEVTSLEKDEARLIESVNPADESLVNTVVRLVRAGEDPLGDAYIHANTSESRRVSGSVYTPMAMVNSMVQWAQSQTSPARVVDCGCGSGRFALAAARAFPEASVIAVDTSPFATLMCKANAVAAGMKVTVLHGDFLTTSLPTLSGGPTLWLGNPPYVRHHDLDRGQKEWFAKTIRGLGIRGSGLAGLHAYFMVSIAKRFTEGDVGCLVMSAEWMDTGYGVAIRDLLTSRLPMTHLRTFDKEQEQFIGTMSSAVIVGFSGKSSTGTVRVNGDAFDLSDFASSSRWSDVLSGKYAEKPPKGYVRLGEFARVHRGVVTGNNRFWVRNPGDVSERLCSPVVSHARELLGDKPPCRDVTQLSRLVTLPDDLAELPDDLVEEARRIVDDGLRQHVEEGFVASHRKRWWSVKKPAPPAILMTYMARRPPVFVVNKDKLAMLNVVHGIYPTIDMSDHAVANLAAYLNANVKTSDGRVYSGGLAKFEPREVERLIVPSPENLEARS